MPCPMFPPAEDFFFPSSVADLLGFTPTEIVGKSWYHFQHACDLDTALACHKTCKLSQQHSPPSPQGAFHSDFF